MSVLSSLDGIAEDLHLPVSRDNGLVSSLSDPGNGKVQKRKRKMLAVDAGDQHGGQ